MARVSITKIKKHKGYLILKSSSGETYRLDEKDYNRTLEEKGMFLTEVASVNAYCKLLETELEELRLKHKLPRTSNSLKTINVRIAVNNKIYRVVLPKEITPTEVINYVKSELNLTGEYIVVKTNGEPLDFDSMIKITEIKK